MGSYRFSVRFLEDYFLIIARLKEHFKQKSFKYKYGLNTEQSHKKPNLFQG